MVLPTGFGKSIIFQVIVHVKEVTTKKKCKRYSRLPSKKYRARPSHIEASALRLTAASLKESALEDVTDGKYQLIFGSAEDVLDTKFIAVLKNDRMRLHQNLVAIVIDESHTVETWTGRR